MVPSAKELEADLSELTDGNVVRAFGAEHVQRLTALSAGQLRYLGATGFFEPKWAYENRRSPHSRIATRSRMSSGCGCSVCCGATTRFRSRTCARSPPF